MRALLPFVAIAAITLLLAGCGGDETTLESLAGTPAAINIVKDVEAMSHACKEKTPKSRQAAVKAFAGLAQITAFHPNATFGPEGTTVTMRELQRRTVEKTGHCFGVSVDANGKYSTR